MSKTAVCQEARERGTWDLAINSCQKRRLANVARACAFFANTGNPLLTNKSLRLVSRCLSGNLTAVPSVCQEARGSSNLLTLRPNMPERSSTQASPQGSSAHFISLLKIGFCHSLPRTSHSSAELRARYREGGEGTRLMLGGRMAGGPHRESSPHSASPPFR